MPNITINNFTQFERYAFNGPTSYTRTGYSLDGPNWARVESINAANSAASSGGGGDWLNPRDGGSSSVLEHPAFGVNWQGRFLYSSAQEDASGSRVVYLDPDTAEPTTQWWCRSTAQGGTRGYAYQTKIDFTLPQGITSDLIANATLTINYSVGWSGGSYNFSVFAPKTTSAQTNYQRPSSSSIIESKFTFSISGSETTTTRTFGAEQFTSVLKQCIDKGQGWITLGYAEDNFAANPRCTLNSVSISYELTTQKAHAPTLIYLDNTSALTSVIKPLGSSTVINWSGATGDVNNNIDGYILYYKANATPTTSLYDGSPIEVSSSTSSYTFSFPQNTDRGTIFYIGIVTKGSAGDIWNSDMSTIIVQTKLNILPPTPTVTVDKTRIKSSGTTTRTFTIANPGTHPDSGQTLTVRYSTTNQSTPTISNTEAGDFQTSLSISAAATYYFWLYDGLEFCTTPASQSITVNVPPAIGSVTMSATNNQTYVPSVTVESVERKYVKTIDGSAANITKDSAATLTYQWKLCSSSTASGTSFNTVENLSFSTTVTTSFTNLDVTKYSITFNKAYKLRLLVTDDLGEIATADSETIFCIPNYPNYTKYNRWANSDTSSDATNKAHFGKGIRIKFSQANSGITSELWVADNNSFTSPTIFNLNNNTTNGNDIDLQDAIREQTYYFKIKYICSAANNKTAETSVWTMTRAKDITPTNIHVVKQSGSYIQPYTHTYFSIDFNSQLPALNNTNDVSSTYSDVYTIKLEKINSITLVSGNNTISSQVVTAQCYLNSSPNIITTSQWISLINGNSSTLAPNSLEKVRIVVIAKNLFDEEFTATLNDVDFNFVESVSSNGVAEVQIQTNGTSTAQWQTIPASTYNNKAFASRYPIFPTQTIRAAFSGLSAYANLDGTLEFLDYTNSSSPVVLGTTTIIPGDWSLSSETTHIYTLSSSKYINYILPSYTSTTNTNLNLALRITLPKISSTPIVITNSNNTSTNNNLNSLAKIRVDLNAINFKLSSCSEPTDNNFTLNWTCTDFGASTSSTKYSYGYNSISIQLKNSSISDRDYSNLGSTISMTGVGTSNIDPFSTTISQSIASDIIYFGATLTLVLKFIDINGYTPTGTKNLSSITYLAQQILYRTAPNLLYGKNFFVINANEPKMSNNAEVADQVLTIRPTGSRNKIYIGYDTQEGIFEITNNGLVIDCGSW